MKFFYYAMILVMLVVIALSVSMLCLDLIERGDNWKIWSFYWVFITILNIWNFMKIWDREKGRI